MEYNKDESSRCLQIATECLAKGDKEKASKLANKSYKLYPSKQAQELLEKINRLGGAPSGDDHNQTNNHSNSFRNRNKASSNAATSKYSQKEIDAVNRIKHCKDYYEILGLGRNADASELKKKYRKLALEFHPDKNHVPGAVEAFKAIGNAFSVLNDPVKRRRYDVSGPSTKTSSHSSAHGSYEGDYSRGFESDMTAEEIFNMFFSGASARPSTSHGTAHTFRRHHHHVQTENWSQLLVQLSPILVLIVLSFASMIYVDEQQYSFVQSSKYSQRRVTENLKIVYFVMKDFAEKHHGRKANILDREAEGVYIGDLRKECMKEASRKKIMRWRAQQENDAKRFEEAEQLDMHNCNKLDEILQR